MQSIAGSACDLMRLLSSIDSIIFSMIFPKLKSVKFVEIVDGEFESENLKCRGCHWDIVA